MLPGLTPSTGGVAPNAAMSPVWGTAPMTATALNHEDDDVWNTVALASVAYQQEMLHLAEALDWARDNGLTFTDLCAASGLSEGLVTQLLCEWT